MNICTEILNSSEIKDEELNIEIFDLVLEEFLKKSKHNFKFEDCDNSMDKVLGIKADYIYTSKYINLFFKILKKYKYNMKQEIQDAMYNLGHLEDPNKNVEVINKLIKSPVIQDISFNGKNEFLITSKQYGDFAFELASLHFKNNTKMMDYMKNNPLPNHCHMHAYFMSELFKDFYSITSLCKFYFKGRYYHSYTFDKDSNSIIDLCYNAVIDKDTYYKIFEPEDVSVILNSKVDEELTLTEEKTKQYFDRCYLLKIALYKQYLNSIGYKGDLQNAPNIQKLKKL